MLCSNRCPAKTRPRFPWLEKSISSNTAMWRAAKVVLGQILTDAQGRLIVVGGPGKSGSPTGRGLDNFATMMDGMTVFPTVQSLL